MSLVKSKAIQLGFDATPTNNFLIYQPLTPDGTFRIANGNQGATTDIMTVTSGGSVTFAGTTNFSSLNFGAGSESAPSLFPTGDSNTGIWFPAADTFAVSTGGSERIRISSAGNIGIGQTNPVYKLDVNKGSAGNIARFTDGVAQTLVIQSPDANGIKIKNDNNGYLSFAGTSAEWMRIDSSGNVGIGTNSPSTYGNFVVNNSATSGTSTDNSIAYVRSVNRNAVICLDGGANNATALQFYQGGVATGHIRYWNSGTINANCITFGGKGADSEIMRLDANGEVQIGNTSAYGTLTIQRKANAPYATLTIGDISTSTNTVGIYLRQSGTSPAGISTAGAPLAFFTGSPGLNEVVRITTDGSVGIGTTSPTSWSNAKLVVAANSAAPADIILARNAAAQITQPTVYGTGNDEARLSFYQGSSADSYQRFFDIISNGALGQASSNIRLYTNSGSAAPVERMRIDGNGTVTIGTTLAAQSNEKLSISSNASVGQGIYNTGIQVNSGNAFLRMGVGSNYCSGISSFVESGQPGVDRVSLGFHVTTYTSSVQSFYRAMTLTDTGTLLLGKTSSSVSAVGTQFTPTGMVVSASSGNTYHVYNTAASTYPFYVSYNGTVNYTSLSQLSDIRQKENIRDLEIGLNEILQLKPRRFDWKDGHSTDAVGFIAQEIEETLPDFVSDFMYNEEETRKSVKSADLIPVLVKAIQEQQEIIQSLKARLDAAGL